MYVVFITQLSVGLMEHVASPYGSGPEIMEVIAAASVTVSVIDPMQSVEDA